MVESIIDPPSTLKKVTQVVAGGTANIMRSDAVDTGLGNQQQV